MLTTESGMKQVTLCAAERLVSLPASMDCRPDSPAFFLDSIFLAAAYNRSDASWPNGQNMSKPWYPDVHTKTTNISKPSDKDSSKILAEFILIHQIEIRKRMK